MDARLKAFFVIICCLVPTMHTYAQNNPYNAVSIASPTAGSLGKFVDIPVSNHTGLPNISIPVYTVEAGPLKLPVSLSYHASGLRVMEPAGWVGAGWALNAGGVITRTVKGAPDESYTSNTSDQSKGHFSNYGYNSYVYNGTAQDWMSFAQGGKDGEPDLFFFNFGGYTGTFFFSDDRKPVLLPEQDLKITCVYLGTGSITSFVITTPDGIKYSFGRTGSSTSPDPVEITNPFSATNSNVGTSISSWYLNRIESADGVFSITLKYTAESYSYYTIASTSILSTETTNTSDCYLVKNFIQGVRLSQISFPNGTVDFLPGAIRTDLGAADIRDFTDYVNTNAASLGAIQISAKYLCKKFNLYTSYFQDNSSVLPAPIAGQSIGTDKKRLRLDSITEMPCTGTLRLPAYKFDYNAELVPRRLTFAQDHWGYFNGATANTKMIPTYSLEGNSQSTVPGANREAKWPEMRGGSLKRITYPTGGYTDFELEAHRSNVSYDSYNYIVSGSLSIGYDGSNPITKSTPVTLTAGDYYLLSVGTTNLGSNASLYLTNVGSTTQIASVTATTAAISNNLRVYIPAGNYTLNIYKDCTNPTGSLTGTGAYGDISRVVSVGITADTIIGGLRVKTITQHDNTGNPDIITAYNYKEDNGISSGQLYSRPVYVQQVRNDLIRQIGYWNPSTGFTQSCSPEGCLSCAGVYYYKSGNSIQPLESTQGNHIGYSTVKVSKSGNGSSTYRYETGLSLGTSFRDVAVKSVNTSTCLSITPNYPPAPVPFNFQRGNLKQEQHFSEAGNILRNIDYYSSYSGPRDSTPAFIVAGFGSTYLGTYYTVSTAGKISETIVRTEYNSQNINQSISTTTSSYFESNYHHELTKQAVISSKGDSLINKYKYAFDFAAPSCQNPGNCKVVYYGNCQTCQTQYNASQTSCAGNSLCVTNAYLTYQQCLSQARVSYSTCRRTNLTDSLSTYNTCFKTALNNAGTDLKPLYGLQNEYRNPVIETSAWNDNTLLTARFNSYTFATDPANKVYPLKTQQINLSAPATTFTASGVNGTALTKDSRYEDETLAVFTGGSLVQFTDKKGVPMAYVWDVNHLLPIAVVSNAVSSQVAYTSFETDGSGTWTVPSALRDTTQGITGKNAYLLSNGAVSKASLSTAQSYIVSYWSKSGSATVNGATATSTLTKRGWNYYEHKIAAGVSGISVSGSITIDELRLYPSNAQMTSSTYIPVLGLNSQCDAANHVTYYEYDVFGRLQVLRDMDYNIIKTYEYRYRNL